VRWQGERLEKVLTVAAAVAQQLALQRPSFDALTAQQLLQ
jgi:hypothetical protein